VTELKRALEWFHSGEGGRQPPYSNVPEDLLKLRHVALSGDGEPTLCPNFVEVIEGIIHLRAHSRFPFFQIGADYQCSGLDRLEVTKGLALLSPHDEVWAKLEAGTQEYMDRVNRSDCALEKVLSKILVLGRRRPVIIQSLFPSIGGASPPASEIEAYAQRLKN